MAEIIFMAAKGPRPEKRAKELPWPPGDYDPEFGGDVMICSACHCTVQQGDYGAGTRIRFRCGNRKCREWLVLEMVPAAV